MSADNLLSVEDAAKRLGVHRSFLDRRRCEGGGPTFLRLSARKIVYRESDLDGWAGARAATSTSNVAA